ncbi:TPA: hypothetical protein I9089_002427 [Clostridium perfringens]|nr:hypothetical protein [Clostridium perfringens]
MNWKEELLNAKEEVIYVNCKRGEGATTTIIEKILNTDKDIKVLYIGNYKTIEDKLLKITQEENSLISTLDTDYRVREAFVVTTNKNKIKIKCIMSDIFIKGINYDIGISDGYYLDIPDSIKGCKQQIIILPPDEEYKTKRLISSDESKEELPLTQRINNYRKNLFTELENIPMNDKTTMTRERIIGMIKSLDHIGR